MLEIEILFNKLSLELPNFFASQQFAAQNLQLAAAVVTLSSTAALTEATVPSKTTSAPMAANGGRAAQGNGVDEDYVPYSKKIHTGFHQSPAAEGYIPQPVISDGLSNYSFRNRSERRSRKSLWSKDKDWSPDADTESSDISED